MFEGMKGLWAKSHKSDPKGQQQQKVPWVLEKTHLDTVVNVTVMFKVVDTLEVLAECLAASPAARVHWTQAYTSNLGPSGQLLSYLGKFDSYQEFASTPFLQFCIHTLSTPSHTLVLQTPTGSATAQILMSQSCRRQLRLSRY